MSNPLDDYTTDELLDEIRAREPDVNIDAVFISTMDLAEELKKRFDDIVIIARRPMDGTVEDGETIAKFEIWNKGDFMVMLGLLDLAKDFILGGFHDSNMWGDEEEC